jgi:hypothetical protein
MELNQSNFQRLALVLVVLTSQYCVEPSGSATSLFLMDIYKCI